MKRSNKNVNIKKW